MSGRNFFCLVPDKETNQSLWAIALMCFFWTTASLMIFSLLPFFLTEELGASKKSLGAIEGVSIFLAFTGKFFAGIFSDVWKSRKPIIVVGTTFTIVTKVLFAVSNSILFISIARGLDRFIKGIRSAPTDALIADLTPKEYHGASYGARQTLDVLGAVIGGSITSLLFYLTHDYHLIFWLSSIPATFALIILCKYVKQTIDIKKYHKSWHWSDIKLLPQKFWLLLGVVFLLMLARFSEAFLNLRAKELGWDTVFIPLLIASYNVIYAATALPIGKLADKYSRQKILLTGIVILIITNLFLIKTHSKLGAFIGIATCGLHMGMTQGIISALVAESTLPHLRGTAFALYYSTVGVAVLIGNPVAGYLSDLAHSSIGAFFGGLVFTTLSVILLVLTMHKFEKNT